MKITAMKPGQRLPTSHRTIHIDGVEYPWVYRGKDIEIWLVSESKVIRVPCDEIQVTYPTGKQLPITPGSVAIWLKSFLEIRALGTSELMHKLLEYMVVSESMVRSGMVPVPAHAFRILCKQALHGCELEDAMREGGDSDRILAARKRLTDTRGEYLTALRTLYGHDAV
jgi:hypothetical protein